MSTERPQPEAGPVPADPASGAGPAQLAERRPGALRSVAYFVVSFPLRILTFTLVVVGVILGVATVVVWVGIPILIATTTLIRGLARQERAWVRTALAMPVPEPAPGPEPAGVLARWRRDVVDPATWRALLYFLLVLPLGTVQFAITLVGVVLVPVAVWVLPWMAWLHWTLAVALLGPKASGRWEQRAQALQASRARGVDAAEAERRRIERDLHDGAQQRLVAVAMTLGRAKARLDAQAPVDGTGGPGSVTQEHGDRLTRDLIDQAHLDAKLAVAELRDLARGIHPAVLTDRGLDAAVSALVARSDLPVQIDVSLLERPPAAVETIAYFIVAEALTNVTKHAEATAAQVRMWRTEASVVVQVTDDGRGGAAARSGGGLAGLADRAATIDGVVTVVSPAGGPTVVRADLPCSW
nr:sensor domain-containing protein [Nakamurella leprariae]